MTLPRTGGTDPATGLTYDPVRGYYYGTAANNPRVDGFVWDSSGVLVQRLKPLNVDVPPAVNYNPNTQALEVLTVSANQPTMAAEGPFGLLALGRDANGLLTGSTTQIRELLPGLPGQQVAPAYDPKRDHLYASASGGMNVVSRSTGELIDHITFDYAAAAGGTYQLYSLGYDPEHEVLIKVNTSKINRRAFVFDLTGDYLGSSALPIADPLSTSWGMAYTNGQVFVTDSFDSGGSWKGYTIFSPLPEPTSLVLVVLGGARRSW